MKEEVRIAIKGLLYLEKHYNVKSIGFFSKMNEDGRCEIINSLFWYIPEKDREKWIYYYNFCMNESLLWRFYVSLCRLVMKF